MMIDYKIFLRDKDGAIVSELTDIISLSISDVMNDMGSWRIDSRTKGQQPFFSGYGIVVYREGAYLYSGFVDKVDATRNTDGSWSWSASGRGDLEALSWRVIFPPYASDGVLSNRYAEYGGYGVYYIHIIISLLIQNNATGSTVPLYRPGGLTIVGQPDVEFPLTPSYSSETKTYRFENLLDTVVNLCSEGNLVIRPRWDDTNKKIIYYLTDGRDLSSSVVFSEKRNDISAVHHILQSPDHTRLVYQFNSDKVDTQTAGRLPMWRYIVWENLIDPATNYQLKDLWDLREIAVSPNDQDFDGNYTDVKLSDIAIAGKMKDKIFTEGYNLEFQSSGTAPMYQVDYRLGDIVTLQFEDQAVAGRVTKVEIDYSLGNESIKPSINAFDTGAAGIIKTNIRQLGNEVGKLKTREV